MMWFTHHWHGRTHSYSAEEGADRNKDCLTFLLWLPWAIGASAVHSVHVHLYTLPRMLPELRAGHHSLAGTDHIGDETGWAGCLSGHFFGGSEPYPANCAFPEWPRQHLQMTHPQNPASCAIFSGWAWLLLAPLCSVFHQISLCSAGVFIMCLFKNKRDAEQSSSKTIKHFIIQDGEGTGLTYNTGSGNGRTMWY